MGIPIQRPFFSWTTRQISHRLSSYHYLDTKRVEGLCDCGMPKDVIGRRRFFNPVWIKVDKILNRILKQFVKGHSKQNEFARLCQKSSRKCFGNNSNRLKGLVFIISYCLFICFFSTSYIIVFCNFIHNDFFQCEVKAAIL